MVAECDSVAAVGDASDGDPGDKQQLVRGVCAAAAKYCWEPECAGEPEDAGALLQHGGICYGSAVCYWNRVAKPGARACLSRSRFGAGEADEADCRDGDGVPGRDV